VVMMSSSSSPQNEEFVVLKLPVGMVTVDTFEKRQCDIPKAGAGEFIIKTMFVSVDPYLRNVLERAPLDQPLSSGLVGEIIQSNDAEFPVGAHVVSSSLPWRRYNVATKNKADIRKIDTVTAPLSAALGVLGMPGQTAYVGLFDVTKFKAGDVVLVSGAAGAVGSIVGQLAKLHGAKKVIGTAGGPDKCRYATEECGFDYCIDYKKYPDVKSMMPALQNALGGDAIDIYFDNTGGVVTECVWDLTAVGARVAICGQISMYNASGPVKRPDFLYKLIYKRVSISGFMVSDYRSERNRFYEDMEPLVNSGKIHFKETVYEGFDRLPEALVGLFHGENTGKAIVKV